jgi:hypothetical protein
MSVFQRFRSLFKEMTKLHMKSFLFLALLLLALLLVLTLYAPHYLNYADPPGKADAVVLFIGGTDMEARKKEANRLLSDGYANCLIIPGSGHIIGTANKLLPVIINEFAPTKKSGAFGKYPHFYENTHIEVLEAKRIMDHFGFKKANFVSAPYHMRRIKMMTDHVFHKKNSDSDAYQINFVPARLEPPLTNTVPWDLKYIEEMVSEYVKMAWFFSYDLIS